jgi:hypothetical protein
MAKKTSKSAKSSAKTARPTKATDSQEEIRWPFGPKNYIIFAIALVVIVIGFVTLGQGSMTLAPFLLAVGYCVLILIAIMAKDKSVEAPSDDSQADSGKANG